MRASTCDHCTAISVLHALKDETTEDKLRTYIEKQQNDRAAGKDKSLPQRYGEEFEEQLTKELSSHLTSSEFRRPEIDGDIDQTLELMMRRTPVIYQGGLEHATNETVFRGRPDFLVLNGWELYFENGELRARQVTENFGTEYKVWDAKYSSHPKPEYALQVAIYMEALKRISFLAEDEDHGLILGNRSLYQLKEAEILPAARLARAELEKSIRNVLNADRSELLENFVWHCAGTKQCEICEYPELCKDDRKETSDLLQVAGLGQTMRAKLLKAGISTMTDLANSSLAKVPDVSAQTFEKLKLQAKIQVKAEASNWPEHELLADPMLRYLPKPDPADGFLIWRGSHISETVAWNTYLETGPKILASRISGQPIARANDKLSSTLCPGCTSA